MQECLIEISLTIGKYLQQYNKDNYLISIEICGFSYQSSPNIILKNF